MTIFKKKILQRERLKGRAGVSEACQPRKAETEQIGIGIAEEQKATRMNYVKWATVGPVQMINDVALAEMKERRTLDVFYPMFKYETCLRKKHV